MKLSRLLFVGLVGLFLAPASAEQFSELTRIQKPWKRAGDWLSGKREPPKLSRKKARALTEPEVPTAEELEAEHEEELQMKWGFVVGILALGATFMGGYIVESCHITILPEAAIGMIVGAAVAAGELASHHDTMAEHDRFDFEFFMIWLLPPIIFEAGFNMNVSAFIENLGPTMFFAFIGTFASTFVVGGLVWYAGQLGLCYPLGMLAALTFGSLISATDPVTVLAVFQALGVKVDLFSMVFGESVLNDAVAIVLSRTLLGFNVPGTEVNSETIGGAVVSFCTIFGGSLLIGAFAGVASALVFKAMDMRHHAELIYMQSALSFAFPWAAYFTSEALELSGIVTILFCGMIMAVYTRYNMSEGARKLTGQAYKCIAVIAETYVFVYLGMAVFTFPIFDHTTWYLILYALGACFVGRLHIYVGSILTNCCRSDDGTTLPKISGVYMFVMWFSGLRGGVAFALASVSYASRDFAAVCGGLPPLERVGNVYCSEGMSDSLAILQTTLMIATFTIFVFGGSITKLAVACDVLEKKGEEPPEEDVETEGCAANMRNCLTFGDHIKETGTRYEEVVEHAFQDVTPKTAARGESLLFSQLPRSSELPTPAPFPPPGAGVEMSQPVKATPTLTSIDDKIDYLRDFFPGKSTAAIKKLIDAAGGDAEQAVKIGQSQGFTD